MKLPRLLAEHTQLAIDTAPLIYFLADDAKRASLVQEVLNGAAAGRVHLVVSVVTEAELLVGPLQKNERDAVSVIARLLDGASGIEVAPVSRGIAQEAARLRAEHKLSLPDAMVAATALQYGCTALLANDAAFARLDARLTYLHVDDLI